MKGNRPTTARPTVAPSPGREPGADGATGGGLTGGPIGERSDERELAARRSRAKEDVARRGSVRAYVTVTLAYWAFMLTDGALRMLVLLHFHTLGFTPLTLAWLFLLYELAGILTNLAAGWLGTRFGLNATLLGGLLLQVLALLALAELDPAWSVAASVAFVMLVQGAAGVAKDLTKTGAKSAVKRLAPSGSPNGRLFRLVALLTGSKNAVKGGGFLLGAALLGALGFRPAVLVLALGLALVFVAIALALPEELGRVNVKARARDVFSTSAAMNRLATARLFLFGARDTWFVVGVPIFLHDLLSDGAHDADARAFFLVGTFMAVWIIGYGVVQASAPALLGASRHALADTLALARRWAAALAALTAALAVVAFIGQSGAGPAAGDAARVGASTVAATATGVAASAASAWLAPLLVAGLLAFGVVFAINSSLHSYLVLALSGDERTTMDVGFYYSANAAGRLVGTLLSGLSYQAGGIGGCLAAAAAMALASRLAAGRLERGARAAAPP